MRRSDCSCVLLGFSTVTLAGNFFVYPKNDQASGDMALTASGDDVAFEIFDSCVAL